MITFVSMRQALPTLSMQIMLTRRIIDKMLSKSLVLLNLCSRWTRMPAP
jgi:hypothetical protein